jgi:hypothetical protein
VSAVPLYFGEAFCLNDEGGTGGKGGKVEIDDDVDERRAERRAERRTERNGNPS